jgi:hypothetical protein
MRGLQKMGKIFIKNFFSFLNDVFLFFFQILLYLINILFLIIKYFFSLSIKIMVISNQNRTTLNVSMTSGTS